MYVSCLNSAWCQMLNITVIALLAVNSKGSLRAPSLLHQMSHVQWPLLVQPATFEPEGKTRNTNSALLKMLHKCRVPCLVVDADIVFHRDILNLLEDVMNKLPKAEQTLHLCPGCIHNRGAVQKDARALWKNLPPEKPITSEKDPTGTIYTTIPCSTCWYGAPMAALFTSYKSIRETMIAITKNMNKPCDVIFAGLKNHYALTKPLCREYEGGQKDRQAH